MKTIISLVLFLSFLFVQSLCAAAPQVTITGKLVDRQCSVEDSFGYQPPTEKRCTLWMEMTFTCPVTSATPSGVCKEVYTVYCPRKAADNRFFNSAYDVCSDPAAMQILHPTSNYTITGWLRTIEQQKDGYGQVQGTGFSY